MIQSLLCGETTDMTLLYDLYFHEIETDKVAEALRRRNSKFILNHHSADALLLADAEQAHPETPALPPFPPHQGQALAPFRRSDRRQCVPCLPRLIAGPIGNVHMRTRRLCNQFDPL
jgi:hypothetical protein